MSAVPFYGSERIKKSRINILLISAAMFRPIAQLIMIFTIAEPHLEVWIDLYNYFFVVILWVAILFACFKTHAVKLLYTVLLQRMLFQSINGIAFRIVELFMPENSHQLQFARFWLFWTGVYLVLATFIIPFVFHLSKGVLQHELANLPMKNIVLLSISPAGFYLAAAIYTFVFGLFSNDLAASFIIIMGLSFSLFQILMIRNTRKLLNMEMKHEFLLDNYQTLENHFTQIAQMKHEMRHHLFAIRTLFENGEQEQLAKYLSDIQDSFAEIEEPISCGNRLIQAVFAHASQLARRMDFEIEFELSPIPPLSIPDTDIVSLFMNLLNNALESCAGIQDPSKRWIKVQLKARHPYLYLSVLNARQGEVRLEKERYVSIKGSSVLHGHGIEVIQKTAKKHNGFVLFEHTDDSFSAEAALAIN